MLRSLPGDSAPRIRLLAKFVEKNYEKIDRLMQLRRDYSSKVSAIEREIEAEKVSIPVAEQEDMADEWLSRRLDAGLFSLQVSLVSPFLPIHHRAQQILLPFGAHY